MATVTEKEILKLKDEAQEIRDQIISAKSTYKEVEKNISNHEASLKELGVEDTTKVEEILAAMEEEVAQSVQKAKEIIKNYKESVDMV